MCDLFAKSQGYVLHGLKATLYRRGDEMVHVLKYTPGLFGGSKKKASKPVTQFNVMSFNGHAVEHGGLEDNCPRWMDS